VSHGRCTVRFIFLVGGPFGPDAARQNNPAPARSRGRRALPRSGLPRAPGLRPRRVRAGQVPRRVPRLLLFPRELLPTRVRCAAGMFRGRAAASGRDGDGLLDGAGHGGRPRAPERRVGHGHNAIPRRVGRLRPPHEVAGSSLDVLLGSSGRGNYRSHRTRKGVYSIFMQREVCCKS